MRVNPGAVLLALIPALLGAADLRVDHMTACGKDLQGMRARLAAVGIASEYGGPHNNRATEMALASFPDGSYLELIAIQPDADAKAVAEHEWARELRGEAGPCAWAARSSDVAAEVRRLKAAGVAVSDPQRGGRSRPDGTRLEWETAQVGSQARGVFFPFLIRDFTPREARVFPQGKPPAAGLEGVAKVVMAVRDLAAAVGQYRQAYGLPAPAREADGDADLALFPGTPVVLAAPRGPASWLSARIEKFGEGPAAFVLRASEKRRYQAASTAQWFGATISWFDAGRLGWRLGFE